MNPTLRQIVTQRALARVAEIEGIIGQMNERLNHIETRLTWMLGTVIAMWVTIILAVYSKRVRPLEAIAVVSKSAVGEVSEVIRS